MKKEDVEQLGAGSLVAYQHGVTQQITAGPDDHGLMTIVAVTTSGRSERKMARANFLDHEWRLVTMVPAAWRAAALANWLPCYHYTGPGSCSTVDGYATWRDEDGEDDDGRWCDKHKPATTKPWQSIVEIVGADLVRDAAKAPGSDGR